MDAYEIKLGTRLELELVSSFGKKIGQTYISQLIDVIDAETIEILCPIYASQFIYLAVGSKIRITFYHEKLSLLSFGASILSRDQKGNVFTLRAGIISEFEKIQRRSHFRLDCNLQAEYRVIDNAESTGSSNTTPFKKAITKNISGGGVCIVTEDDIPFCSIIELNIHLNDENVIKTVSRVIRISETEASKSKKYELGINFNEISEKDQDLLIKYVFEQQRLFLKRGI